jgi:hypothetical protein
MVASSEKFKLLSPKVKEVTGNWFFLDRSGEWGGIYDF